MRHSLALVTLLSLATLLGGCATDYGAFYRETNDALQPRPVPPEQVAVVRSAGDLVTPWTELGHYEGHAPTVKEAMDAAKRECGRAGADYFILDVEPFESRGVWTVVGRCAAKAATTQR
jgi:hypothetical protein